MDKVTQVVAALRDAIKSGDKSKEYDAISLAYRLYGKTVPSVEDCYEEAVNYSGTTTRNAGIIAELLSNYRMSQTKRGDDATLTLTKIEKGLFVKLFNRGGYVLNFSTNEFDVFTMESVGVPLCERYKQPKGKSLVAYINEANMDDSIKLLFDLYDYYEANYEREYLKKPEDAPYYTGYNDEYAQIFAKCGAIVQRIRGTGIPLAQVAEELKAQFSTEYMNSQFGLMLSLCDENPTEAIGKAKELIESCCITILDARSVTWDKDWDVGQLAGVTVKELRLTPHDIPEDAPLAEDIRAILGNLRAIATNVAKLRNPYGSGHGKTASYKGLEKRHARLAVGSSITFVEFLWTTHEKQALR